MRKNEYLNSLMVFFYESFMILKQKIEGIYTDIQGYNDEVASQIMKRKKAEI